MKVAIRICGKIVYVMKKLGKEKSYKRKHDSYFYNNIDTSTKITEKLGVLVLVKFAETLYCLLIKAMQ